MINPAGQAEVPVGSKGEEPAGQREEKAGAVSRSGHPAVRAGTPFLLIPSRPRLQPGGQGAFPRRSA